jgi:hypothetical protein
MADTVASTQFAAVGGDAVDYCKTSPGFDDSRPTAPASAVRRRLCAHNLEDAP